MTSKPLLPPLSPAREAGDFLFVSGQLPRNADGQMVGGGITEQASRAIDNLAAVLARHDMTLDNVVKTTVWLTDAALAGEFNAVYRARLAEPFPARSTVVSGLLADGALIEIEAIAHKG